VNSYISITLREIYKAHKEICHIIANGVLSFELYIFKKTKQLQVILCKAWWWWFFPSFFPVLFSVFKTLDSFSWKSFEV
jgi:hypothetical protein